jgi:hypothetical protein
MTKTADEALLLVLRHARAKISNPNASLPVWDGAKSFTGYRNLYAAALALALTQLQERYGGDRQQATEALDQLIAEGRTKLGQPAEPWTFSGG